MASVNSTVIARVAAGLYDLQLGNASMTWALNAVDSVTYGGDLGALVQQLYNTDFKAAGNAALAATIVKNVGITGDAAAVAYVTNVLNANAGHEGAAIVAMLNGLSGITSGPYAAAATGFNTQIGAASRYAQTAGSIDAIVHAPASTEGKNFTLIASKVGTLDVMNLHGDQDVRIDFSNPANQIVGLDLDGDGVIEFNGKERSITGKAANFEIVDAYSRNPLDHTDIVNNFLGDIYFDGSSAIDKDGDGTKSDGNVFLGGLGLDTALGGVGNDFLAGGGIAQGRWEQFNDGTDFDDSRDGGDQLYGGRNADFFFAEFSMLDVVDGNGHAVLYVDGGNTSDDSPAGTVQTDQDNDWLLLEGSDDDEPLLVDLTEGDGEGTDQNDASEVQSRTGQYMDIEDVENLDASGNLYGFLDGMEDGSGNQLRVGARSYDSRYDNGANDGTVNYGIGTSAQMNISGTDVANIIIAGYDNDFVEGLAGNDLLLGGNLQFLFKTVPGSATNLNLANITLDGLDHLLGGDGNDGIVFEADGGVTTGGAGTDTLWITDYALGTNTLASSVSDGRLRFDLGAQTDASDDDTDAEPGYAGYGGANVAGTADQTNYATGAKVARNTATTFEILDASGLSTGVRGLDYFSAGTNAATDQSFSNRQNFAGYNGNVDLRGALNEDNQLYAGAGDDVIEARGGANTALESATAYDNSMQGGAGSDDFYFSIDGDRGQDETNIIRRKVDANNDGFWDGSSATATAGTWGQDFGLDITDTLSNSSLTLTVPTASELLTLTEAVQFIYNGTTYKLSGLAGATTVGAFGTKLEAALDANPALAAITVTTDAEDGQIVLTDPAGKTFAKSTIGWFFVDGGIPPDGAAAWAQTVGAPEADRDEDRLIFKSYEDRSDNEGIDDDAVTGSVVSLGTDAYAEDLVVSFSADGTRIAEDQDYIITFRNLATEDTVTVTINGVTYKLQVGVALNGTQIDGEDDAESNVGVVQHNFLTRLVAYIDSFMDDDSAAGQVDARVVTSALDLNGDGDTADTIGGVAETAVVNAIGLVQADYHDGEETVFMTTPTVALLNGSGGEVPSVRAVDNDSQTEVFLQGFDGRDNKLNADNVLFWGQESISRAILETAKNGASASAPGDTIVGSEAQVIDGGSGAGDDDITGVVHNKATDRDFLPGSPFEEENFAVHGDDYLIGGTGDDTISGMTGDDRVRGSLGNDTLDGGKDWYAVKEEGERTYDLEYLNAYEAIQRDDDGDVLDMHLILQTENGTALLAAKDDSPEEKYEAYFDDTLIYHQADFTAGVTRFTITLNDYLGTGEDIAFNHGGAGTVGVDNNGDGTVEIENISTFTNFENIRTVAGIGTADAGIGGKGGQQGRDTLNINELSDDADVGVRYDMTGDDGTGGDVVLLEDLEFVDLDLDGEDDDVVDNERVVIKVDGVENVIFGDGDDVLLIDETEAAKDNVITGDLGEDEVTYLNDFGDPDEEPTVTINVGARHSTATDAGTDKVVMTEGRVGLVVATDTLNGIETITLAEDTAGGLREDDTLNVEALSAGATVNYITGEIFSDTDGDLDFDDGDLQLTVNNLFQVEIVIADGKDAVVVGDSDIMGDNTRTDDETADLTINSHLNYDLLDERDDLPTRLTIAELRAIDGGTADTADEDDIPEGYNFAQFQFILGEDTDTVDYSEATDAINAVIDLTLTNDTQYIMVDADGGNFDGLDDDEEDRVDALTDVERVVASQGESVLDFTGSDSDVEITFQYTIDEDAVLDADDGYSETNAIRIADGEGDTIQGLTSFIERYTAEDGDTTNATWSRIEGSDNNETVIYEGSENLSDQFGVDHRFSDDTLNLRGGDNTVSYSPLETSITASIDVSEYDEDDPTAAQIEVTVEFQDGDFGALTGGGTHMITSYADDNALAPGSSLKLEASQDAEDTLVFTGDTDKLFIVGQSPGVITVDVGEAGSLLLTGFEFVQDSDGDDTYDFRDLGDIEGDLEFIDSDTNEGAGDVTEDRDSIKVYDDAVGFDSAPAHTISLEVLNDIFRMDFDVLDITGVEDDQLLLVADDDDHDDDAVLNKTDLDYDDDFDYDPDYDRDGDNDNRDTVDDVIIGDLDLIDDITGFNAVWFTDASITTATDDLIIDIAAGELQDSDGDAIFTVDSTIFNFSLVTEDDLTISVVSAVAAEVIGGGGDDTITGSGADDTLTGGGGDDTLDGGAAAEERQIQINPTGSAGADGTAITITLDGFVLTLNNDATIDDTDADAGDNLDITPAGGSHAVGAALETLVRANLDDINDGVRFGGVDLVDADYDNTTGLLTFTFASGTDVAVTDTIAIAGAGLGTLTVTAEVPVTEGTDGGSDTFVFNAAADGADTILNFLEGDDTVEIAGALRTLIDDDVSGALTWDVAGDDYAAGAEALFVDDGDAENTVTAANLDNLTVVAAAIEAVFDNYTGVGAATDDLLIVVEADGGGTFGIYYFDASDTDEVFEAAELTLIAVVSADDIHAASVTTSILLG